MRRIIFAGSFTLLLAAAYGAGAYAQQQQATRIETDQKTGVVKIIVNEREVARFERDGLHVRDSIAYGGLLTDTGPEGYNAPAATAEPKH